MIRSSIEEAQEFFARARRIAVVGVSREPRDFTRFVLRELVARGHDAVPVNPALEEAHGLHAFPRVQDIHPSPDAALLMVPAARAEAAVRDCLVARVKRIWFHRGAGPGAASEAALALCRANRIEVVQGLCPLMALPEAGLPHRLHGLIRRALSHPAPSP
jgi:predicted CoA-binding protein